ncbi:outer membrane protein assembly factor BamE [Psychroserpens luteolus]|uniref:outer membrane protein assembly factor BamE n=1 Tax=Psychroserpens luteolus TaxID=2855840 RepID=UPI001E2DC2A8|nr:outer membrane protein assembly factor BamE [Psychroserpens luteolus]MCD2257910.1 outer membrane protein assembly factor BamE [Psychroserpens luteolus]
MFRIKKYDKVVLFFFAAIVIGYSLIWLFEERFDRDEWITNPRMRYKMADHIVSSDTLIGKTKEEVIFILGSPDADNLIEVDHVSYDIGKAPSFFKSGERQLIVFFESNLAFEVAVVSSED